MEPIETNNTFEVLLSDFVRPKLQGGKGRKRVEAAKLLCWTPSGVTLALQDNRQIFLQFSSADLSADSYLDHYEIKGNKLTA